MLVEDREEQNVLKKTPDFHHQGEPLTLLHGLSLNAVS
jgi:hypothetical protein